MKIISENRRSRYDYAIEKKYEAGIILTGSEVKSLRNNGVQGLAESYIFFDNGVPTITNMSISPYSHSGTHFNHVPTRNRVLLLSRREIGQLTAAVAKDGMTIVPVRMYFDDNRRVKIEIALAKGKTNYDKRQATAERDWQRRKQRGED
jgi:SsrA-binding protein